MELTQRQACARLETAGVHRPAALRVLACGLAGPARRVGGGPSRVGKLLYDERRVDALLQRRLVSSREPEGTLAPAALVVSTGPRRSDPDSACGWSGVDLSAPPDEQLEAVRRTRRMALGSYALAVLGRRAHGSIPLIVIVNGFVAVGADIIGIDLAAGRTRLDLRPPGPWFELIAEARVLVSLGSERRWLCVPAIHG